MGYQVSPLKEGKREEGGGKGRREGEERRKENWSKNTYIYLPLVLKNAS